MSLNLLMKKFKLGAKAASKAITYFQNKNINYRITTGLTDKTYTYCSELVWYSYYKAGKDFKISIGINFGQIVYSRPSIIGPYDFLIKANLDHNKFKIVKSVNW